MPVVTPSKVTFPAKTRLYFGEYGTPDAALAHFGLLGADANLNLDQTFRQKMDMFPEVEVASAIQAQSGSMEALLREWKKPALLMGLGLHSADVTEAAGGDTTITAEEHTFGPSGYIVLSQPLKLGEAVTVTPDPVDTAFAAGTDYVVVERDAEGRTLIVRIAGGGIGASASVLVTYDTNTPAFTEYPVGRIAQSRYWTIRLEEDLTNGGRTEVRIHRARIGLRGGLALNAAEGADMPVTIQALFDPTNDELMSIRDYDVAPT